MSGVQLPPTLLALTPGTIVEGREAQRLLSAVDSALGAGLRGILLREPALSDRLFLELARELGARLSAVDGWLGIHDRAHVALSTSSQGLHLGFRSLTQREARAVVGPKTAIGFSAHAGDAPGQRVGADYLFLGPLFDTPSKRGLCEPLGHDAFAREVAVQTTPVWAIGGIGPEEAAGALAAGAKGVAVRAAILCDPQPAARTAALLEALSGARA